MGLVGSESETMGGRRVRWAMALNSGTGGGAFDLIRGGG